MGDLDASSPSEVAVEMEFLFQLQGLVACVGLASSLLLEMHLCNSKAVSVVSWLNGFNAELSGEGD